MVSFNTNPARDEARKLLGHLWKKRAEFFSDLTLDEVTDTTGRLQIVQRAPEIILENVLGYRLNRPNEIRDDVPNHRGVATSDVAGMIDRRTNTVTIARRLPLEQQRFTLAHEIGHIILHPQLSAHRDRPLVKGRFNAPRSREEREADAFAAEFLMPAGLLSEVFVERFGGPLDGSFANNEMAFKLSITAGRSLRAIEFSKQSPFDRAILVAGAKEFGTNMFEALSQSFIVSRTAMAIRLVETELVR
jgi:uncharacterized protein DUF955